MAENEVKNLPACPVETTLTLIGNKWKVLILRDLLPGTKAIRRIKKVLRLCKSEGAYCTVKRYGGGWSCFKNCLS